MENAIVIIVIVVIIALAVGYIIKNTKKGNKCIGCPESKNCMGNCSSKENNCKDHQN